MSLFVEVAEYNRLDDGDDERVMILFLMCVCVSSSSSFLCRPQSRLLLLSSSLI